MLSLTACPFPKFARPPVNEVVLSVQFQPIEGFTIAHMGMLWASFRKDFPVVLQQAPVNRQIESFGPLAGRALDFPSFEFLDRPPSPRIWFVSTGGQELIQLQEDRLMHNWRAQSEKDSYPSYSNLRPAFIKQIETFSQFLEKEKLGTLVPDQCEVTYINLLPPAAGSKSLGDFKDTLQNWPSVEGVAWLAEPELTRFSQQFMIKNSAEAPYRKIVR